MGFPPGITSPREDCRPRATPSSDNPEVVPGGKPTRMSYLYINTQTGDCKQYIEYRHLIPVPVCQCLVFQTSMDNMSQNKPSTSMANVAYESKLLQLLSHLCIPAREMGLQSCARSCSMHRLPRYLVQELHVGTVYPRLKSTGR